MKIIFRILKPYWFFAILVPFFIFVETILELFLPKLMIDLMNVSMQTGDKDYLFSVATTMIIYSILALVCGAIGLYFSSVVSQKIGADLREEMFVKIQKFSFNNIDKFKAPSLITRLTNDITQVQLVVTSVLRQMARATILSVGGVVMSYSINPKLASISFISTAILFVVIGVIMNKSFSLFKDYQERLDDVNGTMRESLSGIRVVKAFVREDYEIEKFDKFNEKYRKSGIEAFKLMVGLFPLFMILLNGSIAVILLFGGFEVNANHLKAEEIMALITYLLQMMNGLMLMGRSFSQISRAKTSLDRVQEVLDEEIDLIDGEYKENISENKEKTSYIEYKNVSFNYNNNDDIKVIKNISFKVEGGKTLGILGETGSGKSSLVNLLVRLYEVSDGEILLDGKNIKDYKLETLHDKVAIVLQNTILFSGTIKDNIKWGKSNATDEEIIEACKTSKAHDFIMKFPDGYDTILGQKGVNLSGGQKQRISIARSLIKNPKVIVFDDSTSAVDSITETEITNAMQVSNKGCTKIIIAQRISSVMNLDNILVIKDGEIVAEGNHENLINDSEYYKEIYYSQKEKGGVDYEC